MCTSIPLNNTRKAFAQIIFFVMLTGVISTDLRAQNLTQRRPGAVRGVVKTSDDFPAELVTAGLKGRNKGATTNSKGEFEIRRVDPGNYTLTVSFVGLETKEIAIEVSEGETVDVGEIMLNESSRRLEEITISDRREYLETEPSSSLRIQTPLIETPQSIIVVTSDVIRDQQLFTTTDVIRNVSGVTSIFPYVNIYTDLNIRGTRAGANALRNGMQLSSGLQEDMSYVDKVEFVKGPAGFMLAQGEPGGMYNVVTRKPLGRNHASASLVTGSYGLFRSSLDVGNTIGEKVAYRVNAMGQKSGSHLDFGQNNRVSVAPVVRYQLSDKTSLTVEYNLDIVTVNGTFAQVPTMNGKPVVPKSFMIDDPGIDPARIRNDYGLVNLHHQFNDEWSLTAQIGAAHFAETNRLLFTTQGIDANNKLLRNYRYLQRDYKNGNAQVYLNGNVRTGSIGHTLLIGFDGGVREAKSKFAQVNDILPIDIYTPVYGVASVADTLIDESAVSFGPTTKTSWQAFTVLDHIKISEWLHVAIGGRYTWFLSGTEQRVDNKVTPRAGILIEPMKNTSVYALYDQSFLPQTALSFTGQRFEPLTGSNIEFGIKREFFDKRLFAQVAVYNITKNNVLTSDPDHPGFSIQRGQVKSKGVELDVIGAVSNGFTLVGNYAYTDAKITRDTDPNIVGTREQAPVHTMNAWAKYSISKGVLSGLGAGIGGSYYKDRYIFTRKKVPTDPQQKLDDFASLNAALFYQAGKLNVALNVDNLTDEFNFIGTFNGAIGEQGEFQYISMPGRNFRLSVSVNF